MAVPSKAGSIPKLSQLQATLRKSSAPKPGAAAPTQSLKRAAEEPADGAQAKKIAATSPVTGQIAAKPSAVKASITKQPSAAVAGKSSGPGLQAKGPPPAAMQAGGGTAVKGGAPERPIMTKAKANAPLEQVPVKRPPPVPVSNGQQASQDDPNGPIVVDEKAAQALVNFTTALKGTQGKPKLVLLTRLVDAISQDLQIEQSLYIMRLYRKKMIERAMKEGVPVNAGKAPAVAPAVQKQAAVAPAAAVKSAAPAKAAPTAATTMSSPPAVKATASTLAAPRQVQQSAPSPRPAATAAPTGAAAPPDSPPATDFADEENPLISLIGSLTEDPVCEDGLLKEGRLTKVLELLWNGIARGPKDWQAAWQAMLIPQDKQVEALQKFLNFTFVNSQGHGQERAPLIIADLVKAHKIKFSVAEEVLIAFGHNLDGILAINEEAWHVYSHFFVHIHPQPKTSGWGWSRIGWDFKGWLKFVEKSSSSLDASKASDVLGMCLRLLQDKEGTPLNQAPSWTPERLKQVSARLAELGACSESEAISRLAGEGVSLEVVAAEGE